MSSFLPPIVAEVT